MGPKIETKIKPKTRPKVRQKSVGGCRISRLGPYAICINQWDQKSNKSNQQSDQKWDENLEVEVETIA